MYNTGAFFLSRVLPELPLGIAFPILQVYPLAFPILQVSPPAPSHTEQVMRTPQGLGITLKGLGSRV